jgi:molybdenum cofactor synthesis domain-containing protein
MAAYTAAILTISDKGFRGERADTSGPALKALLEEAGWDVVHTAILPDELEQIKGALTACADEKRVNLVLTTGGTGFSPRDVTPEATLAVVERETRGIPEAMRAESLRITPRGCLSRSAAGIRGRTLIVNLPGSEKAARENLLAVRDAIGHGISMLLSAGSADCAAPAAQKPPPSMHQWLREAKASPDAGKIGMYLTHNGVVRETARASVREGAQSAPVKGMRFSYNRARMDAAVAETRAMEGIYYVRAWLNEGELSPGDDIMYVLVGGDIRPRVIDALQFLVGKLKNECVTEQEIFA